METKRQTKAGSVEFSEHFQVNKENSVMKWTQ